MWLSIVVGLAMMAVMVAGCGRWQATRSRRSLPSAVKLPMPASADGDREERVDG
jgi:hypothetical protein